MAAPLKLLKTHEYPAYQIKFQMQYKNKTADLSLRFAVLTVMDWLRQRINDDEYPQEMLTPSSDEFETVKDDIFMSCHYSSGYNVDITSMMNEGKWALCLREPDMTRDGREAVIGRFFDTNISFAINDAEWLDCAIKTVVLDPLDAPEVDYSFRPAIVRTMLINSNIILRQEENFGYCEVMTLDSDARFLRLNAVIKNSLFLMPTVIFTYVSERRELATILRMVDRELGLSNFSNSLVKIAEKVKNAPKTMNLGAATLPYDVKKFAHDTYGYGRTCLVPDEHFESLKILTSKKIEPGDILLLEPECFGGKITVFKYSDAPEKYQKDNLFEKIEQAVFSYSKKKEYPYDHIVFESELREKERQQKMEALRRSSSRDADSMVEQLFKQNERLTQERDEWHHKYNMLCNAQQTTANLHNGDGLITGGDENDLYPGETQDYVLEAIMEELARAKPDSRRQHVFKSILNENNYQKLHKEQVETLKKLLRDYTGMNARLRQSLANLGIDITEDGKHYKLIYHGDSRYQVTMSKTPSDGRGALNLVSEIKNKMF